MEEYSYASNCVHTLKTLLILVSEGRVSDRTNEDTVGLTVVFILFYPHTPPPVWRKEKFFFRV